MNGKSDDGSRQVPSVLLEPQAITKETAGGPSEDGFLKTEDVCTGKFAQACSAAGL